MEGLPNDVIKVMFSLLDLKGIISLFLVSRGYRKFVAENLEVLNLSCNRVITDEVLRGLKNLKELDLRRNFVITDEGLKLLVIMLLKG